MHVAKAFSFNHVFDHVGANLIQTTSSSSSLTGKLIALLILPWFLTVIVNHGFMLDVFPTRDLTSANNMVISMSVLLTVLSMFYSRWQLSPIRKYIELMDSNQPIPEDLQTKAYLKTMQMPSLIFASVPFVLFFIFVVVEYSFVESLDIQSVVFILTAMSAMIYGTLFLITIAWFGKELAMFHYNPQIKYFSGGKRIYLGVICVVGGLLSMTASMYDSLQGNYMVLGFLFMSIQMPVLLLLPYYIVQITIKPTNRIIAYLKAAKESNYQELNEIPNFSAEELGYLTYQMAGIASEAKQQLDENIRNSELLASTAEELSASAEEVTAASENIASAQQEIAMGTSKQVSSIIDVRRKFETLILGLQKIRETTVGIAQLGESIRSISGQTNILALNASIEAARAGEVGRGFSVVADQVRKLAEESRRSVENSEKMLKEVNYVTLSQEEAGFSIQKELEEIVVVSEETASNTEESSAAAEEQSSAMQNVNATAQALLEMAKKIVKKQ